MPVKKLSARPAQCARGRSAAALLHQPQLLLLDEPTIGLDVVMQKKVREFVKAYNKRHGATIMLTSHNMTDVVELCKRVIVIERGVLLYDGPLDRLVARYADHKILRARFTAPVAAEDLKTLGTVDAPSTTSSPCWEIRARARSTPPRPPRCCRSYPVVRSRRR